MAGRKGLRMARADRPDAPGEAARTAQGRLAIRLQLRRPQPDAPAEADRLRTTGKARGAVRLKGAGEPETASRESPKPA